MKTKLKSYLAKFLLILFMILIILPFLIAFFVSIRPRADLYSRTFSISTGITLERYISVFGDPTFLSALVNTFILSILTTLGGLLLGVPAGYTIARYKVGGQAALLSTLALRFFPTVIIVIPAYVFFSGIGALDSIVSLLPMNMFLSLPLVIWIIHGFVMGVPKELEESALIDGCTRVQAMFKITLPLIKQGLVVASIFPFIYTWNELLIPLVMTMFEWNVLTVYASDFITDMNVEWGHIMAVVSIMALPPVLIVTFFRNALLQGFLGTGLD